MTTMVEKMARAMADHDGFYVQQLEAAAERGCGFYDGIANDVMNDIRGLAQAALRTLLEPSETMEQSGNIALSNNGLDDVRGDDSSTAFIAMIRTALDEVE